MLDLNDETMCRRTYHAIESVLSDIQHVSDAMCKIGDFLDIEDIEEQQKAWFRPEIKELTEILNAIREAAISNGWKL